MSTERHPQRIVGRVVDEDTGDELRDAPVEIWRDSLEGRESGSGDSASVRSELLKTIKTDDSGQFRSEFDATVFTDSHQEAFPYVYFKVFDDDRALTSGEYVIQDTDQAELDVTIEVRRSSLDERDTPGPIEEITPTVESKEVVLDWESVPDALAAHEHWKTGGDQNDTRQLRTRGTRPHHIDDDRAFVVSRRSIIGGAVALIIFAILATLGLNRLLERKPTVPERLGLLVPADLTQRFDLDPMDIPSFVRTEIGSDDYPGIFRGAYGTLWAGAANIWDRTLLAAEALQAEGLDGQIVPTDPPQLTYRAPTDDEWNTIQLDAAADEPVVTDGPPEGAVPPADLSSTRPELFHTVTPAFLFEDGRGTQRRVGGAAENLSEWIYRPVVVEAVPTGGELAYHLRVGDERTLTTPGLGSVARVSIEFTYRFDGQERTWTRELFDRANAAPGVPGNAVPREGDRYAVVVATGPFVPDVLETRNRMVNSVGYTPLENGLERMLVVLGTKYVVDADAYTRRLQAETNVDVSWQRPRLVVVASEDTRGETGRRAPGTQKQTTARPDITPASAGRTPERSGTGLTEDDRVPPAEADTLPPNRLHSLDVLADAVEVTGDDARQFRTARGMANDQIEAHVLFQATRVPVVNASTVLSQYKSETPNTPNQRIERIEREVDRLLAQEPYGTRTVLVADRPGTIDSSAVGTPADGQSSGDQREEAAGLALERAPDGIRLHGVSEDASVPEERPQERYAWDETGTVSFGDDPATAAVVADVLLCERLGGLDYQLRFEVERALDELSVTDGSILEYRVTHGDDSYSLSALVSVDDGTFRGLSKVGPDVSEGWSSIVIGDDSEIARVVGEWPEVISMTPLGPRFESYTASVGTPALGSPVSRLVKVGDTAREVDGVRTTAPQPELELLEAQRGGRWYSTWFIREGGLLQSKNQVGGGFGAPFDVSEQYLVHLLGYDSEGMAVPPSQIRSVRPAAIRDGEGWRWVNVLEEDGDRSLVHPPGYTDERTEWVQTDRLRPLELAEYVPEQSYQWDTVEVLETDGDRVRVRSLTTTVAESEWVPAEDLRQGVGGDVPEADVVLRPGPGAPLVLEWRSGDTELVLESVSPAVHGRLVDERTGRPIAGADVTLGEQAGRITELQNEWHVVSAADGSFRMPVVPVNVIFSTLPTGPEWNHPTIRAQESRDIRILLADSASMTQPVDSGSSAPRRIDLARAWMAGLIEQLPFDVDDITLDLWTYSVPTEYTGDYADPALVTEQVSTAYDPQSLLEYVDALALEGLAPLTAAVNKLADDLGVAPSDDTSVILLSDGENVDTTESGAAAYQRRELAVPIHVVGVDVAPGTENDRQLERLAEVSGGRYWRIDDVADIDASFDTLGGAGGDAVRLRVQADDYDDETAEVPIPDVEADTELLPLHRCLTCPPGDEELDDSLLTIRAENVSDLSQADGLSPKAERMIRERVADGRWAVKLPKRRTNVAAITAYAWFEVEEATGRIVGRTEDGLHGSTGGGQGGYWPPYNPASGLGPQQQGFIAWYQGIVAYTTASVLAAFDWRNSPGFPSGSAEDFARFVQANALTYVVDLWGGEQNEYFWAGVCLNFDLQSAALGVPSDDCHRLWFEDLCHRMVDYLRKQSEKRAKKALENQLKRIYGEELGKLLTKEITRDPSKVVEEFVDRWTEGRDIVCEDMVEWLFGPPDSE